MWFYSIRTCALVVAQFAQAFPDLTAFPQGKHFLIQGFPLLSETWDSGRPVLLSASQPFPCDVSPGSPCSSRPIFSLAFLLSPMNIQKLAAFYVPHIFNSRRASVFLTSCSDTVTVFLPAYLPLLPPSECFLFVTEFGEELLVHPHSPSDTSSLG